MDAMEHINELLDQVVAIEREHAFCPEYRDKATDTECLGLALASYFAWDERIVLACLAALEDANFHVAAEALQRVTDVYAEIL